MLSVVTCYCFYKSVCHDQCNFLVTLSSVIRTPSHYSGMVKRHLRWWCDRFSQPVIMLISCTWGVLRALLSLLSCGPHSISSFITFFVSFMINLQVNEKGIDRTTQTPLCGFTLATHEPLKFCSDEYVFERFTSFVWYNRRRFVNCFQQWLILDETPMLHQYLF